MEEGLRQLKSYAEWLEELKALDRELLIEPIAEDKWSTLDILCHIWLWDLYIMEHMIPKMGQGAAVHFVPHDEINSQVRKYTESHAANELLPQFIEARRRMAASFEAADAGAEFYVDKRLCNYSAFIEQYVAGHDLHHRMQVERFVESRHGYKSGELIISTDKSLLDMETVFGFLSRSYWADKRSKERILKSIDSSICYGAYIGKRQVAFARVVTDGATMYWLCDVYVDESCRGKGIGKRLVQSIVQSNELKDLMGILGTKDAHGLYASFQFEQDRDRMMRRMPDYVRNRGKH